MKSVTPLLAPAVVGVALATVLSCRQIVGIGEASPPSCGLSYGTTACASCVDSSCCPESTACQGDAPCADYFDCLGACKLQDWQCRSQCRVDHPTPTSGHVAPLKTCMVAKCSAECGLKCGAITENLASPGAAPGCQACFEANACTGGTTCGASAACRGWLECNAACSLPDCRGACNLRYGYADAGTAEFAFTTPPGVAGITGPCAAACAFGANWSCVGRVSWPTATAAPVTLTTRVLNFATNSTPVEGADVSLCRFVDPTCTPPLALAHGQTDSSGFVSLNVAASPIPQLGFDTFAQITSPAITPLLYFLGYPVSQTPAPIAEPYVLAAPNVSTGGASALFDSYFAPEKWDFMSSAWVNFDVYDCEGGPAAGVQVEIDSKDPGIRRYYLPAGAATPSFTATATASSPVGAGGGFINVPPGKFTLTATPLSLGKRSATVHGLARAGTMTEMFIFPTP